MDFSAREVDNEALLGQEQIELTERAIRKVIIAIFFNPMSPYVL